MFALKQVSLMALLIALAYAAPQSPEEEVAEYEDTEDYINVSFGIILVHFTKQAVFFDQIP
jgi:hypothetical protein